MPPPVSSGFRCPKQPRMCERGTIRLGRMKPGVHFELLKHKRRASWMVCLTDLLKVQARYNIGIRQNGTEKRRLHNGRRRFALSYANGQRTEGNGFGYAVTSDYRSCSGSSGVFRRRRSPAAAGECRGIRRSADNARLRVRAGSTAAR